MAARRSINPFLWPSRFKRRPVVIFLCLLTSLLVFWALSAAHPAAARRAAEPFPGYPPPAPAWAYEPWVWEDNGNTRAAIEGVVKGYRDRSIPVGAVIIDSPWETHLNTLQWDTSRYPEPQKMIQNFHQQGVRVLLWITGFVNTDSPDYNFVRQQGYAVNNGQNFSWWKGTGVHLDFTNPQALAWWHARMDSILDMGVDGWKVDQSPDFVPATVITAAGSMPRQDFKKYYYADFYDYSLNRDIENVTISRPVSPQGGTGASISKNPLGWCGDFSGDFAGLKSQMEYVYEAARLGYGAPGVEVGGYNGAKPTKASLLRYAQFGALTPVMENGGANGGLKEHLPWTWGEDAVSIYRYYATLHSELVPILFSYGVEASLSGKSIIRSPDSTRAQHLLGEELFVSVITSNTTSKQVTFPAGSRWIDYWDETRVYSGGTSHSYSAPLDRYPIFIRSGAIVPMNVRNNVTGHGDGAAGKVTLLVYPDGKSSFLFHRPLGSGLDYDDVQITVDEAEGSIQLASAVPASYRLRVKSFSAPASVSGADSWHYDAVKQLVVIDRQGSNFKITIQGLHAYGSGPGSSPTPGKTPAPGPGLISSLQVFDTANAADWSVRTNLQPGDQQYGDRPFTITSIGGGLAGADWIRTANDSKEYTGTTLVSFKVAADAEVYVAHRDDLLYKPGWLSAAQGWTDSGIDLVNSEPYTYSLFKKSFSAGSTVSLGKNGGNNTKGMYTVLVRAAGSQPPPAATRTPTRSPTPAAPTPTAGRTPTATSPPAVTPTRSPTPSHTPGTMPAQTGAPPLFADAFDRPDADVIGGGWTELEPLGSKAVIQGGRMCFSEASDKVNRPYVRHKFSRVSSGTVLLTLTMDWTRTGTDNDYAVYIQLGDSAQLKPDDHAAGMGPSLVWTTVNGKPETLGYLKNGVVTAMSTVRGPAVITVSIDLKAYTYEVRVNGQTVGTGIPFEKNITPDTMRIFSDRLNEEAFSGRCFDDIEIRAVPK